MSLSLLSFFFFVRYLKGLRPFIFCFMVFVHLDLRKVAGVFGKPNGNLVPFWRALDSGATGKVSKHFSVSFIVE